MNAQQIVDEAARTGIVWLGGEMEFPANEGPHVAFHKACYIAEACGYLAGWRYGHSAFSVAGGDIPGYVVVDWFRPDNLRLEKIELWTCKSAYLPHVLEGVQL